jgi:VanZ family protein
VRKFHGWPVAAALAAALAVLGLEQQAGIPQWMQLARRYGDEAGHFYAAFVLTAVLFWQTRSRRWWRAGVCAIAGAAIAALGEVAQKYFSVRAAETRDVVADVAGAAAALAAFLLICGAGRIELILARRPRILAHKYEQRWLLPPLGYVRPQPVAEAWSPAEADALVDQPHQRRHPQHQRQGDGDGEA